MTNKQFVETLRNIKEYCARSDINCFNCKFSALNSNCYYYCRLQELIYVLSDRPNFWDIEEIERVINE